MSVGTAWPAHLRPNQQAVEQSRHAPGEGGAAARRALGLRLRATLPTPPLLLIRSHHTRLIGSAGPATWGELLAAWHGGSLTPADRRGGNHPAPAGATVSVAAALKCVDLPPASTAAAPTSDDPPECWAALVDADDLAGLPAALTHWGRGRVGIGATIADGDHLSVLLAADAAAYTRLCRLLSARHADAHGWRGAVDATGIVVLVRDAAIGAAWQACGAEVYWRADLIPETRPVPFPIVCAPLLDHLDARGAAAAPVLAAIRTRGTVDPRPCTLATAGDLLALPARYSGHADQLAAGIALRHRLGWAPQGWQMPPLPPELAGRDPDTELRRLAEAGLAGRYPTTELPAARARLAHELAVIAGKRFASYILTVWAICRGRRTCGRGSGASSIVCYLLGITNVDPLRLRLVFERFLAPERSDPPDLDVDFPWDERDAVFSETIARFGTAHVAMVATHQHLNAQAARREAARAHGLDDAAITAMTQRLAAAAHRGEIIAVSDLPPPWPAVLAAAEVIAGAPRHLGLHCGGVVITTPPVRDLAPVHAAAKRLADGSAVPALAWEKDGAEILGLVKIDLLGNRSLAVVRDALAALAADGVTIDEQRWRPEDDPATRRLVASGATMGCFYIESPAMRQLQAKVGSGDFDRLVVHSSIIRPAANALIGTYIARHHHWLACGGQLTADEEQVWYPHPALRDLISDSYGILSYQEDVMLIAQRLAGFASAEANALRKALGRADTFVRLQKMVGRFTAGCRANDVSEEVISLVWNMISSFAGYSFCKAHSASYAAVSFQCAWLKAHHPAYFLAAVIANEGGFYSASAYVEEARRLGLTIHAPCVLRSQWTTSAAGAGAIRLGFQHVHGLPHATASAIIAERARTPFAGIADLVQRCRCPAAAVTTLLDTGAFDALTPTCTPAQRAWLAALAARSDHDPHAGAQLCLDLAIPRTDPVPPTLPTMRNGPLRGRRYHALGGILPEAHPLTLWKLPDRPATRARDVRADHVGRRLSLIARAITSKTVNALTTTRPTSGGTAGYASAALAESRVASGAAPPIRSSPADLRPPSSLQLLTRDEDGTTHDITDMAFVTLEDETGLIETVCFPAVYTRDGLALSSGAPLRVTGVIQVDHGVPILAITEATAVSA